jgi:hypothetical protein
LLVWDQRKPTHETWAWIGAVAAAALLLVAFASPISAAAPSKTTLSNAVVSPRTGTTATTILISVVVQNADGARADVVTAMVGGAAHVMIRVPGGSWGKGVTFSWSGKLSSGTHAVVVTAQAKDHSEATLAAGSVSIAADPTPQPTDGTKATPTPTPTPTAAPRRTAAPTPKPTAAPQRTAAPTPTPTAAPQRTAAPTPEPTPPSTLLAVAATVIPPLTPPGVIAEAVEPTMPVSTPDGATLGATPTGSAPPITATIAGSSGPGGSTGNGSDAAVLPGHTRTGRPGPWGPVAGLFALAGLPGPSFPSFSLGPTLVTTSGAVAAAMAFGVFGRRRRDDDDDPSDELMAVAAARGLEVVPAALAGAMTAGRSIDGFGSEGDRDIEDMEALMPRWRRPSLLQARKADPIRDNTPAPRLTFGQGLVGPLNGRERRVIRYRVVRLLDSPDELRGAEIGYLDQGDEVQLLEKYGAYWLILCPDGRQGWLHNMTLGEIVEEDGPVEGPVATMPTVADSWTMGESDIDSDVFAAYLESRRRRES